MAAAEHAIGPRALGRVRFVDPHEAHDVQYVHWRQILFDVAGLGWLRPAAWARTQ